MLLVQEKFYLTVWSVKGQKKDSTLLPIYSFPKEKQEPPETDVDCAIREIEEETGYKIAACLDPTLFFEERVISTVLYLHH